VISTRIGARIVVEPLCMEGETTILRRDRPSERIG